MNASPAIVPSKFVAYWQFVVTTLAFATFLILWLVKEWRRLRLFVTRFYCVVATMDLLAEGLLQPFHHCTADNLACTGRMFLVFLAFWLVLHPLESRFLCRKPIS